MQVRKRLRLHANVSAVSMLAILVLLFLTIYRIDSELEASKIVNRIVTTTFERVTLRTDYLRIGDERSKTQVIDKHRQIRELLKVASEKFADPEGKKIVDTLIENHKSIGNILDALIGNREKSGLNAHPDALSRETESQLLSQLTMRIHDAVLLSSKLQESANAVVISSLSLAGAGILLVILVISAAILINSRTMSRAIADRIGRLSEGALVIGEGNLDHRIDLAGDDEFTGLSAAFNAMTEKLRRSNHELHNEIDLRKRVEEALLESNNALEARVLERAKELGAANESVQAERQRLYGVLETLPVYVILLTRDYHVPFANRFFRERFGESHGERCFEYLFHRAEPCQTCESYTVLGTNAPHHWYWTGPDSRNYDIYDFPFVDSDGSKMILEMGIDITEQKRAEAAMRLAGAYNRNLIEVSLDPLVTISAEGKVTDVNAATEAATGCSRTELIGTDFCDYFTEPEKARAGYEQVFREGSVRDYALELRHRNGHVTPVLYNASVYRDEKGTVIGVFAAARDITEQKQAQRALRELNAAQEQRILERTAELHAANETLRAARAEALNLMGDAVAARRQAEEASAELQAVNKELESFIYSVSHDLRAPLRSVAGFTKIVDEDYARLLDEKGKDYLARIYNGAEKMSRLIEDLLRLSRVSRQDLLRTQVDLSAVASSLVAELQQAYPDRKVDVDVQEGLSSSVDRRLIDLAITNLIGNAWKFTAKTPNARIEFGARTEEGKTVYYVRDNGAGFDPSYAEKVFLPFQRLHSESEFEGSGIGLSIVERVIRRHGGKVWAEGKPEKGATIFFTLA